MPGSFIHFGAIRYRVVGSGNLDSQLIGLDPGDTSTLAPIVMSDPAAIEPRVLCNFTQQRARLKVSVNVLDEWFRIKTINIYVKELWKDNPG